MSAQFKVNAADPHVVARLKQDFSLPDFIATIMATRGIVDSDQAAQFLNPSLDRDWANPYDMPGIGPVVDKLEEAIRSRRHIVVFGDFDVDGVSATSVLTRGLRALGGYDRAERRMLCFLPDWQEEQWEESPNMSISRSLWVSS